MKNILKKSGILIIFVVFFLVIFIQHQFVYLHHDDYGYASLCYAYVVDDVDGHDLSLTQITEFLKGHYEIWGGRILYFFIEIVLISNGVWLFRLFQSLVITIIFYLIYKIVQKIIKNKMNKYVLAICTISLYGIFEINLLNHGIFWFSASVLYIIPMLPFLAFIYFYQDSKKKIYKNKLKKILTYFFYGILIFLATFSQEQVSIAALGYIGVLTIYNTVKNKKIDKKDIIMITIAILGFLILMLAPGNKARQGDITSIDFYSKPFIERTILGMQNLILRTFSSDTKIFNIIFYFCIAYTSIEMIKLKKGKRNFHLISLVSIASIIFISIIKNEGYFEYIYYLINLNIYRLLITFIFLIQLLLMFLSVVYYLYNFEEFKLINIIFSAVLSIICMIVAPYFATRSAIIFIILCFIFILYVFTKIYNNSKDKKIVICIMIPIIVFAFGNISIITKGYYNNNLANRENTLILEEASKKIKKGEIVDKIILKKLPNILYSAAQPYMPGSEYILYYIREYYDIPQNIEIIYE